MGDEPSLSGGFSFGIRGLFSFEFVDFVIIDVGDGLVAEYFFSLFIKSHFIYLFIFIY